MIGCASVPIGDLTCYRMDPVPWDDGFVQLQTDTLRVIEQNNRTLEQLCDR